MGTSFPTLFGSSLLILSAAGCVPDVKVSSEGNTGGSAGVGGASHMGGSSAAGGKTTTGGAMSLGGTTTAGGTSATGGAVTTGGTVATGGVTNLGGAISTGGSPATGGFVNTGGNMATGGAIATGGATATGGAAATGGAVSAGGNMATGGATATSSNAPWSKRWGSAGADYGNSLIVDANDNIYVTGGYTGTTDFGNGPLSSVAGTMDIFLAKYSASGNCLWVRSFGGTGNEFGANLSLDNQGNVLLIGTTTGTVDFGGGSVSAPGTRNTFIAKFDENGAHVWSKCFGMSPETVGYTVAPDSRDNLYITGYFDGQVNFGGATLATAGDRDIFLAKLDANGNHLWSKRFGSSAYYDSAQALVVEPVTDSVLISGLLGQPTTVGGAVLGTGTDNLFLAKFDSAGAAVWSKGFASGSGYQLALEPSGNIVLGGWCEGSIDLGGGPLPCANKYGIILAKFDSSGNHIWSKGFGSPNGVAATVAIEGTGDIVTAGLFDGSINIDGTTLTSVGSTDAFIAAFTGDGQLLWHKQYGDSATQGINRIAVNSTNNVLAIGTFAGTIDFGNGLFTSLGDLDMCLANIVPPQ